MKTFYRDATNTMTKSVTTGCPSVAKPVSRRDPEARDGQRSAAP